MLEFGSQDVLHAGDDLPREYLRDVEGPVLGRDDHVQHGLLRERRAVLRRQLLPGEDVQLGDDPVVSTDRGGVRLAQYHLPHLPERRRLHE
jgi:hypothetical protein